MAKPATETTATKPRVFYASKDKEIWRFTLSGWREFLRLKSGGKIAPVIGDHAELVTTMADLDTLDQAKARDLFFALDAD